MEKFAFSVGRVPPPVRTFLPDIALGDYVSNRETPGKG